MASPRDGEEVSARGLCNGGSLCKYGLHSAHAVSNRSAGVLHHIDRHHEHRGASRYEFNATVRHTLINPGID
jgi:hypothetical protein